MASTTKSLSTGISPGPSADGPAVVHFTPAFQAALRELVKAWELAIHSSYDPWELAVEIGGLTAVGITATDLRWLVRSGYAEHAREVTELEDDGREFRPTGNLSFAERTCFVLTTSGASFAHNLFSNGRHEKSGPPNGFDQARALAAGMVRGVSPGNGRSVPGGAPDLPEHADVEGNGKTSQSPPIWDCQSHELRVRGLVVKHFKCPAANQEAILAAFEEEGWPPRIDDPLPPQEEQDSKRRLNDTIKCLNKNQAHKLICFHGDGTGEGVLWSLAECEDADSSCPHEDCPRCATVNTPLDAGAPRTDEGSPRLP